MKRFLSVAILAAMLLSLFAVLPVSADDTYVDTKWNFGYAVISPHNGYGYTDVYAKASNFASTDVFTIPKKGTKLTWTDDTKNYAYTSICAVSSWKEDNGKWVFDPDGPLFLGDSGTYSGSIVESAVVNGVVTYTYVTSYDNEHLRLSMPATNVNQCPKIKCEETSLEGSWTKALKLYYPEPDAPVSAVTGTPIDAKVHDPLKWSFGYVGSDSHTSVPNQWKNGSNVYMASDAFLVEKKGTTVYFFDDNATDQADSQYASSNAYVFSFWDSTGKVLDTSLNNLDGAEVNQKLVGNHKMYWYTTEKDNMYIRLCYRSGLADLTVMPHPYKIYIAEPETMIPVTETGKLVDASYVTGGGKTLNYKIYLPEGYAAGKKCKTVFSIGADQAIADALIADKTDAAVVEFNGEARDAELLIDAAVKNYGFNKYFLYLAGSEQVKADCGKVFAGYAKYDGAGNALEAGKTLLKSEPLYYGVLEGKTMYAMGDSYFAGPVIGKNATWVNLTGDKYGMNYVNYGIGGSTVSDFVTDKNPMCRRYTTMEKGDADIILLEGGRNDRTALVPLGTNDGKDTKTFLGALNVMIDNMLVTYPNAVIILVTPWYNTTKTSSGLSNVDYADAMYGLAAYRNDPRVVCLYAADRDATGVDMNDSAFRTKYCNTPTDVSHLNVEGMLMIQPYMEKFLAKSLAAYLGTDLDGKKPEEETTPAEETTAAPTSDDVTTAPESTDDGDTEAGCAGCGGFGLAAAIIMMIGSAVTFAAIGKK